jgi:membrane protein YdbS with pleckstrin-like domain
MVESLKSLVLRILRVPAEPTPPAGSPESVRIFRASRKLYYLTLIRWGLAQLATFTGMVIFLAIDLSANLGKASVPLRVIEVIALISFLVQLPFTFLFVRFDYEMRWYIVTDRSLRIRYGMLAVREMTMAFANIQQITLRQGPLQRLLGIADLEVRTAGGGAGQAVGSHGGHQGIGHSGHLGFFRGVENAADIRDLILARLRHWRDSGLGDPDEIRTTETVEAKTFPSTGDAVAVAQLVLVEVRALRAAICPDK